MGTTDPQETHPDPAEGAVGPDAPHPGRTGPAALGVEGALAEQAEAVDRLERMAAEERDQER